MAATDQNYRSLKTLDIIFAVSCILMLLTIVGMFAQDYLKEYKKEQYEFRNVETAMAERDLVRLMPVAELRAVREAEAAVPKNEQAELTKLKKAYHDARRKLQEAKAAAKKAKNGGSQGDDKVAAAQAALDKVLEEGPEAVQAALKAEHALMSYLDGFEKTTEEVAAVKAELEKVRAENISKIAEAQYNFSVADASYRSKKADYDSKESLYYIAVDRGEPKETLDTLRRELDRLRTERDDLKGQVDQRNRDLREAEKPTAAVEMKLADAEKADKEKRTKFERYQKLIKQKEWSLADTILSSPVMDMFNSPYKIHQYTLEQYPIDYSFKYVTRYDRCATCHLGMEKADFDQEALAGLVHPHKDLEGDLLRFREALKQREDNGEGTAGFKLADIPDTLKKLTPGQLPESRIKEFAAHPRLDLFVGPDSPHPAERFGCTSCHSGQGSATDFVNATHTPNTPHQKEEWAKSTFSGGHGWEHIHFWDYPMTPKRFTESGCLKCHHQVTDLIRYGSKEEAPKLLEGYNLVRENGCFGCHEIAGLNKGRQVGPDMRLEPGIPLEAMSPMRRAEVLADTANPPGTMRKVGPSLYRLNEKTNPTWLAQWVYSPRGFRPDTRMPHFYNLPTLTREELAKTGSGQEDFPDAEIQSIVTYLTYESGRYLDGNDRDSYRRNILARMEQLKTRGSALSESEDKELKELTRKLLPDQLPTLELRDPHKPLKDGLFDHNGRPVTLPDMPKDGAAMGDRVKNGARLFMERGCLACHQHSGPTPSEDDESSRTDGVALKNPVTSDAHFGPNLSRLASKLGQTKGDKESARRWLVQWLLNPNVHFPRTRMPVTYLSGNDANDVALYLLEKSEEWKEEDQPNVPQPSSGTLARLTAVYLQRVRPMSDVNKLLSIEGPGDPKEALRWLRAVKADSDEAILAGSDNPEMQKMLADPAKAAEVDQIILANAANPENQKRYIGRKAIVRQGCFACHNIPGYETSKPIGTPLNDWGKKDPERLAFEDGAAFVKDRYHLIEDVNTYQEIEAKLRKVLYSPEVPESVRGQVDAIYSDEDLKADIIKRVKKLVTTATAAIGSAKDMSEEAKNEIRELDTESKHIWESKERKPPFEEFYYEGLEHHFREGFLQLKLLEPRSYDYKRQRAWDDRLRMPQFRFAHPQRQRGETDEAFDARRLAAEAEAREAVMTFILGLVAEPVPPKYLNTPKPDRLAEVKGRQVLDKFNCAGCHQVRSGVVEFKPTPETIKALEAAHAGMLASAGYQDDFPNEPLLRMSNAWKALPQPLPDRLMAHGAVRPGEDSEGNPVTEVFLTQAMQFTTEVNGKKETRDILAGSSPPLMIPASQPLISNWPMLGGAFPNLLSPYIAAEYKGVVQNPEDARSKLPPSLLHEGERVQTDWLFQFLRDPQPVRPESWMALRMPKFNMSEDEARTLVDYFAAVDRLTNPGVGLVYPYQAIPQREEKFWRDKTQEYRSRLKPEQLDARLNELRPFWKLYAEDQQADLKIKVAAAEASVKAAEEAIKGITDATKKATVQTSLDNAKKDLDVYNRQQAFWKNELERNFPDLEKEWRETGVYAADGFRVLTKHSNGICASCHNIGVLQSASPKAPPLDQAFQRLRPDWTARWIAHPQRMLPYTSPMPQNFLRTKDMDPATRALFEGNSFEQVQAVRDVIMNFPKVADMPGNRYFRPTEGGK